MVLVPAVVIVVLLCPTRRVRAADPGEVLDAVVDASVPLLHGSEDEKVAAAVRIGDLHALFALPILEEALVDPSALVRIAVVLAISGIAHEDAVEVLLDAAADEDPTVATAAVAALGDMHIEPAYGALLNLMHAFDGALEEAVLDALRRWNEPFAPLPEPVSLPAGADPPMVPPAPEASTGPSKGAIDPANPYGPPAFGDAAASPSPDVSAIDTTNPYGPYLGSVLGPFPVAAGTIDIENPYLAAGSETPTSDSSPLPLIVLRRPELAPAAGLEPAAPPHLHRPLDLWSLSPGFEGRFSTTVSTLGSRQGHAGTMALSFGWLGRVLGVGAEMGLTGASYEPDIVGGERWIANNLGFWVRHAGSKDLGGLVIAWGGALSLHLPTASRVGWSTSGEPESLWLPSIAGIYSEYYRHGMRYPDLENTFRAGLRPDVDLALVFGAFALQVEFGFDLVFLGDAVDPDTGFRDSVSNVVLMHAGLAASLRPVPWLQIAVELTGVFELSGRSVATYRFDRDLLGTPAASEGFLTPSLTFHVPAGDSVGLDLWLALRVPLGDIGSARGPLRLGPGIVMGIAVLWDGTPSEKTDAGGDGEKTDGPVDPEVRPYDTLMTRF